jgi:hypothetical protein
MQTPTASIDLTQRPPRSHRIRLGGYVMLPRILDKARAQLAGKIGEYRYGAKSMDRHFFTFTGIEPDALLTELATGKGDGEVLAWIEANAKHPRQPWEIGTWSEYHLHRGPDSDAETLTHFAELVGKFSKTREDIRTWFDLLDLDDHCTFGGKA